MKINLMQLDAGQRWRHQDLAQWLAQAPPADLTVFPECYPFLREAGISHTTAQARLEEAASTRPGHTFMAGGYVYDLATHDTGWVLRNRVYLVHRGCVVDFYDKQVAFEGEAFTPGSVVKLFAWGEHRCLPLICADADQGPASHFMQRLTQRAIAAGAGPQVPIVVCSYGAMLTQPYWTDSLHHLANTCNAPLLICGIAGISPGLFTHHEADGGDGKKHHFGGGGSGLFLPGGQREQHTEAGVVRVNLATRKTRWQPLG